MRFAEYGIQQTLQQVISIFSSNLISRNQHATR